MEKPAKIISDLENLFINPLAHPKHYLIHKYWGRKPHNLVNTYIKHFTKKNDTVLDPFMGSGGVLIESNKLSRDSIGFDINPMACMIVTETLKNVDLVKVEETFKSIISNIPKDIYSIQTALKRKEKFILENAIWDEDKLVKVKISKNGKTFIRNANKDDVKTYQKAIDLQKKYSNKFYYPDDEIMRYVRRNNKKTIDELFSSRNLLIASWFLNEVEKVSNKKIKESLKFIFTSALPNFSKMIPGDIENVRGKSGWQISKFWAPKIHTEKNVIISLNQRLNRFIQGKEEISKLITKSKYKVLNSSSEDMKQIKTNSVDYIFTDPPYGESIAYLALSSFWNSWLRKKVDYQNEIIYDPFRNKREEDYQKRLEKTFYEMSRVLKKNKYLSMTFHNRHLKFWKILMDSCTSSGFEIVNVKWVNQAVASGTQGINRKNTLTGDFIYTFKNTKDKNTKLDFKNNGEIYIKKIVQKFKTKKGFVTPSELYEELIPIIISNNAYYDSNLKLLDIDKFLNQRYEYLEINNEYGWKL